MNGFITPQWVTTDTAVNYKNNLKLIGRFDRSWDDTWANKPQGAQIGYTVQVRLFPRFVASEGEQLVQQPILNQTVPLTINHRYHVGCGWSSAQDALEVEEVQRYTKAAGIALANKWDVQAGREVYKTVANAIGAPNTPLSNYQTWTDGVAKLRNLGVPDDQLIAVVNPLTQSKLLSTSYTQFSAPSKTTKIFNEGQFSGPALGIDEWYWDPNIPTHTTGTFTTATPVISGALQTGSTLTVAGMGTYALKAGDEFTVAGLNSCNPHSYEDTGDLLQFSLQADVSGTTTGTLTIYPPIITSGPLQTCVGSPANGAALSFIGATGTVAATMATQTSKQSLVFNPAAFAFVMVDLPAKLPGAVSARKNDKETGVSLRWAEQYNIQSDQLPSRVDSIGGIGAIIPAFAMRAWS